MNASRMLRYARRHAGLTQRGLAELAGVPQPTIARIESGAVSPRIETFDRLLAACGFEIAVRPRLGLGVDRTIIRELLDVEPADRLRSAVDDAAALEALGV